MHVVSVSCNIFEDVLPSVTLTRERNKRHADRKEKKKIKEKSSHADGMFVYVENLKERNNKPTPRTD